MRKLLILVLVLGGLAAAADRGTHALAQGALSTAMQQAGDLDNKPDVGIAGFPFLTQVVDGHYDEISVTTGRIDRGGVDLSSLAVTVQGVDLPLGKIFGGSIPSLAVDGLTADATVGYGALSQAAADTTGVPDLVVSSAGRDLKLTGTVRAAGKRYPVTAVSTVRIDGTDLVLRTKSVKAQGASRTVEEQIARELDARVPIGDLPFGLTLDDVRPTAEGLALTASADATILKVR